MIELKVVEIKFIRYIEGDALLKKKINHKIIMIALLIIGVFLIGCNEETDHVTLGMKAINELRYEEGLELFAKEIEVNQTDALAYRGQGLAYMGQTNYTQAIISFEQALESDPGTVTELDFDINYYLATALYRTGNVNGAIERYSAIIDLKDDEINAYFLRGTVRLAADLDDLAISDFEKVIELAPTNYEILVDIYTSLADNGLEEKGKEYLHVAINQSNEVMENYEKGMIYYYLGEYESARDFLALDPDKGGEKAILLQGKSYEALGEYHSATTVYKTYLDTLEVGKKSAAVYNQLALSEKELGNYHDALNSLEAALEIEDEEMKQTLQYNEIVIYEYLKDFKKATVLMEEYLDLYPDDEVALREYEFLKTR